MNSAHSRAWLLSAVLFGLAYCLVGRLFSLPSGHARTWRLAAWFVSGMLLAAHILLEHFRARQAARPMAVHVAVGVAIGAVALAVVAMVRSLLTTSTLAPAWILALVIWPAATGVPAFLIALFAGKLLGRHETQVHDREGH